MRHASGQGRLTFALVVTLLVALAEVAAGWVSGSLALISDAGHMLVDASSIALALVATRIASRPSDARRTFGYGRVEVLIVPVQVVLMLGVAAFILVEAWGRIGDAPDISVAPVLIVGAIGLAANLLIYRVIHAESAHNLSVRGATLEVLFDAGASAGAIISAVIIAVTGWVEADLVVSVLIALLIIPRAIGLLRHVISILLETAPAGARAGEIAQAVGAVDGVNGLHDLHIWSLKPGFVALSAHVEVGTMAGCERPITAVAALLRDRFGIDHVTLQPETRALHEAVNCCEYPDAPELHGHIHEQEPSATHLH